MCDCSDFDGSLELIWGCMMSSKTSNLLQKAVIEASNKKRQILYINSTIDTRSIEAFSTHNPFFKVLSDLPNVTMEKHDTLPDGTQLLKYDSIYIDEAQFFKDLFNAVIKYVEIHKKSVIVGGLIGDSNRSKFGTIVDLIPYADFCTQLHASCVKCFDTRRISVPANFTHKIIPNSNQVDTGGVDKYIPVCRKHYLQLNK